jgi:hypothetical protein
MTLRRANLYVSQVQLINRLLDAKSKLRRGAMSKRETKNGQDKLKKLKLELALIERLLE